MKCLGLRLNLGVKVEYRQTHCLLYPLSFSLIQVRIGNNPASSNATANSLCAVTTEGGVLHSFDVTLACSSGGIVHHFAGQFAVIRKVTEATGRDIGSSSIVDVAEFRAALSNGKHIDSQRVEHIKSC